MGAEHTLNMNHPSATKVVEDLRSVADVIRGLPARPAQPRAITAADIAAMFAPPLTATGAAGNGSTMSAVCGRGHVHEYLVRDIIDAGSFSTCKTCASGTKFSQAARQLAEAVLGAPFTLDTNGPARRSDGTPPQDKNLVEYTNHALKVSIACYSANAETGAARIGDYLVMRIKATRSEQKLATVVKRFIAENASFFDPATFQKISEAVQQPPPAPTPRKSALPHTAEYAAGHPHLKDPNVVTREEGDALCIENCTPAAVKRQVRNGAK